MATTETTVHRALADERRARIVTELRSARDGLDVQELARRLALHANTVRWHLGILRDAGVVESHAAARSAPGRPRILYALQRDAAAAGRDEYRLLATMLTGALAQSDDAEARAETSGRAWGRYLVKRPEPFAHVTDEAAAQEVAELLDEQGFATERDGREIRMRRCPFHDLAETNPDIVCAVHRGLMSGALEELGSGLEVEGLDVFVEPDLCIARLKGRAEDVPSR